MNSQLQPALQHTRFARPRIFGPLSASSVPEITVLFWVIKILTTGMGETASDFLVKTIDPVVAVALGGVTFAVALLLQFAVTRYIPWVYWLAVAMVSVFGTMAADVTHIVLGVPYVVSTVVFALALAAIFVLWFRREGTLSIHSITTRRRGLFYWATVLATFALGTAAGDLTATTFHLGYLGSGFAFALVIAVPAILALSRSRRSSSGLLFGPVFLFWLAYVTTRPLGASFADWMGVSSARGGLAWGTGPVTAVLAVLIVILVGVITIRGRESRRT